MKNKVPKIALLEIGKNHAETMLSQMIALKNKNCHVVLCSDSLFLQQNDYFKEYIDEFHELSLPKSKMKRFVEMKRFNHWMKEQKVDVLIANTAGGKDIAYLCMIASKNITFVGIIHSIKKFRRSFTQGIISRKIKHYFVLNDTLKNYAQPRKGITVRSFYPLNFPSFESHMIKPTGEFWIALIGEVNSQRKDLDSFIQLAEQTPDNVHFFFLGKAFNERPDVQQFKKVCRESSISNRIHLFDHYLSNQELQGYIQQIDGILLLIHPNTLSSQGHLSAQITGAVPLSFGLKIPMLIHEHYKTWDDFHHSAIFYNFDNFKSQFALFQKNRNSIRAQMQNNPSFSSEIRNKQFGEFILSLV